MNCKQGDLAVVVAGCTQDGKIVRCLKHVPAGAWRYKGVEYKIGGASWEIDPPIEQLSTDGVSLGFLPIAKDAHLRPLRDTDGEDETISWAGKPEKVGERA